MSEADAEVSPERARPTSAWTVVFCGGKGGTGRTTLAAALAVAALEAGLRIRLVDADGATAGLTHLLARAQPALRSALLDQASFEALVADALAASRPDSGFGPDAVAMGREAAILEAVRAWRTSANFDLVLIDASAGVGADVAALAAAADIMLVVADPYSLHDGQERRLMAACAEPWRRLQRAPACRAVLVNRAPPGMDGTDAQALVQGIGMPVDRVATVALDVEALRQGHPHDALALEHPVTRFAHAALQAFDGILAPVREQWPEAARDRWQALAAGKARAMARIDAQRELEAAVQRKWAERWPQMDGECRRLSAELERLRQVHAEEQARQGRLVEELRQQGRGLRAALEAADGHARRRRSHSIALMGVSFAAGILATTAVSAWLGRVVPAASSAASPAPATTSRSSASRPATAGASGAASSASASQRPRGAPPGP